MKNCVILGILMGLLMVNLSKGQITQLSCTTSCACTDICTEATTTFGCSTCQSDTCTLTGTVLTFTFVCDSSTVVGTYDNPTQTLAYTTTTITNNSNKISSISSILVLGLFSLMYLIQF